MDLKHRRSETEAAWREFLAHGRSPGSVKPEIVRSWMRAHEWRVDPALRVCPAARAAPGAADLAAEEDAARLASEVVSDFAARLAPDGHVVAYFDRQGVMLAIGGAPSTRRCLEDVNFAPGACWTERAAGTNGIGTALVEEHPVEVFASEHFVEAWQPWTCASVPVRREGVVVGVVDITSPWTSYHPALLPLAEALARTVEARIEAAAARQTAAVASRAASDALEAREQFFAVASHELRTPLTPLQLKVQRVTRLLHRGGHPMDLQKALEALRGVDQHVRRVVEFIDECVDASHLEDVELRPEPTVLADVVRRVLRRHGRDLRTHGCTVAVVLSQDVTGWWDRAQLERAFAQVLVNAITYAPGRIEVELEVADARAYLRVRDHGPGIDAADRERIFRPFERAVSYRNIAGLGVGLHLARRIVEAHGGSISVDSARGRGCTFVMALPLARDRAG